MSTRFVTSPTTETIQPVKTVPLSEQKIGFYGVGSYLFSVLYHIALHERGDNCFPHEAPVGGETFRGVDYEEGQDVAGCVVIGLKPGRTIRGAFDDDAIAGMDHSKFPIIDGAILPRTNDGQDDHELGVPSCDHAEELVKNPEIGMIVIGSTSSSAPKDIEKIQSLMTKYGREDLKVYIVPKGWTPERDAETGEVTDVNVLCQKHDVGFNGGLAIAQGLRDPLDSFLQGAYHRDARKAAEGAALLQLLSPNTEVVAGTNPVDAQVMMAMKNIMAWTNGMVRGMHDSHTVRCQSLISTLQQAIDITSIISAFDADDAQYIAEQPIRLSELGYNVDELIGVVTGAETSEDVKRIYTYVQQQQPALVDFLGSNWPPEHGKATRNLRSGIALAEFCKERAKDGLSPPTFEEIETHLEGLRLPKKELEGLKSLEFWPFVKEKSGLADSDTSMVDLMYDLCFGDDDKRQEAYDTFKDSSAFTAYCAQPPRDKKAKESINLSDIARDIAAGREVDSAARAYYEERMQESDVYHQTHKVGSNWLAAAVDTAQNIWENLVAATTRH